MERVNDTFLINIDINPEDLSTSTVEIITHIGTVRIVLNTFSGADAELVYRTLVDKYANRLYLDKLKTKPQLSSFVEEELDKNIAMELNEEVDQSEKWVKANPALVEESSDDRDN